jgi:hypothetical protein
MSKVIVATVTDAGISTVPWDDPADEVASGWPPPALCMAGPLQHVPNGQFETGAEISSIGPIPEQSEQSPDYAARLRAAFPSASKQALVSREDAMGAAAEIEQLWAALRILVGCANGTIPPNYQISLTGIAPRSHTVTKWFPARRE